MPYTIFDLFCGTGGFSHGIESARPGAFETKLGVDILEPSLATFAANHNRAVPIRRDLRRLSCKEVAERTGLGRGQVDVIVGGPPCQGFSSIRPFRSTNNDDPRNTLFEQFANFVNYFRPKVLVMENVVGLATHQQGDVLARIVECFEELGYTCDWRILNAAHYGVPQRRERLVLVGADAGTRAIFPKPSHESRGSTIGFRERSRMLATDDLPLFRNGDPLAPPVTVLDAIDDLPAIASGEVATNYTRKPRTAYQADRRVGAKTLTLHDSTKHTAKMLEIIRHSGANISCIPKHLISSGFSSCYSRLDGAAPSVTITVNFVHPASNRCIHPKLDRALTPREGARLQSFDDTFIFSGTRSQIVKQIGNAVPPLLGRAVGKTILEMLEGSTAMHSLRKAVGGR